MKHDCGVMKEGLSKTKMFLTRNKDDGNKMCTMGMRYIGMMMVLSVNLCEQSYVAIAF
jgi:hypothetical protein